MGKWWGGISIAYSNHRRRWREIILLRGCLSSSRTQWRTSPLFIHPFHRARKTLPIKWWYYKKEVVSDPGLSYTPKSISLCSKIKRWDGEIRTTGKYQQLTHYTLDNGVIHPAYMVASNNYQYLEETKWGRYERMFVSIFTVGHILQNNRGWPVYATYLILS